MNVVNKSAFVFFSLFGFFLFLMGSFAPTSENGTVSSFPEGEKQIFSFASDRVDLNPSWIKQRADRNKEYLLRLDPDRLLHNFRINAGIASSAQPLEGWESPNCGLRGQPMRNRIRPLSFLEIDRKWEDGDTIELMFDYPFYLKSMPDNDQVIAVFYGPVLLAFETDREVILKGNRKSILQNLTRGKDGFTCTLTDNQKVWRLVPFYQVSGQSYGVYATIRNEY
jgi:hypothetical protein